jgi:hypothetical protein
MTVRLNDFYFMLPPSAFILCLSVFGQSELAREDEADRAHERRLA